MEKEICKHVVEQFCFEGFHFEGIRIRMPASFFKTTKQDFDLIVFHPKKVIFFVKIPDRPSKEEAVISMRTALNCLCNKFSISMNHFVVCGVNEDGIFILNKFNDQIDYFSFSDDGCNAFFESVENELVFGPEVLSREKMQQMREALVLYSGSGRGRGGKERTMTTTDGRMYIRKHGGWKEASEIHPETLYLMTVFGGIFGTHLFFQKKYVKGILYLLSFGLFGFGWFFDCLEILLGVYRDPDGRYVAPLQSTLLSFLILAAGTVFFGVVGCALFFIVNKIFL